MKRADPFRTLDDPAPAAAPEARPAPVAEAVLGTAAPQWLVLGRLRVPLDRPNWFRRLLVRLLLGWRWDL